MYRVLLKTRGWARLLVVLLVCLCSVNGFVLNPPLSTPHLVPRAGSHSPSRSSVITAQLDPVKSPFRNLHVPLEQHSRRLRTPVSLQAGNMGTELQSGEDNARKIGLMGLWVVFLTYASLGAPEATEGASLTLLKDVIKPFWIADPVNPLFTALFSALGLWPAVFASLLLPLKPKDQQLPAWPFVSASFFGGAFGLIPYLAFTKYAGKGEETVGDSGAASKLFGGKPNAIFLTFSTIVLIGLGIGLFAPNDLNGGSDYPVDVIFYTYLKNYPEVFLSSKLAHISTIDFFTLWALSFKPLLEDMRRRGWYSGDAFDNALLASFMGFPLLGACTWLAIRPPIPAVEKPPAPEEVVPETVSQE